jgi:hypothetical protein
MARNERRRFLDFLGGRERRTAELPDFEWNAFIRYGAR